MTSLFDFDSTDLYFDYTDYILDDFTDWLVISPIFNFTTFELYNLPTAYLNFKVITVMIASMMPMIQKRVTIFDS